MEDLKDRVKALIDEVDKTHRYSMSRIYRMYNEVFGTAEPSILCELLNPKSQITKRMVQ